MGVVCLSANNSVILGEFLQKLFLSELKFASIEHTPTSALAHALARLWFSFASDTCVCVCVCVCCDNAADCNQFRLFPIEYLYIDSLQYIAHTRRASSQALWGRTRFEIIAAVFIFFAPNLFSFRDRFSAFFF